jgi:hypothetical protein
MPNPWDPLRFPIVGDADPYDLYAAVGTFVSEWEAVEMTLAQLYSIFVGQGPAGKAIQDYGRGRIFRERLTDLERVAQSYFIRHNSQNLEGEFDEICLAAKGFADRRNEVAHGLVMEVSNIQFFRDKLQLAPAGAQHLVIPPYHAVRNHAAGFPVWAYNGEQIRTFARRFIDLNSGIKAYREQL